MPKDSYKKGGMMNSGKGMYSYKSNPLKPANRTNSEAGPGSNPDQQKVNKLLQKAQKMEDSQRGKSGM